MECYPAPGYKMRRGRRCTDRSSDLRCHLIPSDHPRRLQTKCIDLGGDAVQPECGNFGHFHKRGLCNECATWFNVEAGTFIQPEARRLCEENRVNVGSGWNFVDGLELPSPFTAIAERPPLIGDCILSLDDMEGWQHNSFGWVVDACPRTQTVTAAMGSLCGGEVFVMPRHSFVILERAKLMHAQQMMPNAQAVAQALQASKAPPKVFKLVGMSAEEVRGLASQVSHEVRSNDPHAMIRGPRPANCLAGCVNPAAGLHHHICPNRRA